MMKLLRVTYGICVATGAADGLDFEDWVLQLGASGQVH